MRASYTQPNRIPSKYKTAAGMSHGMSVPPLNASEIRALGEDFRRIVAQVCPARLELAEQTLARVPPLRWSLEWFLPCWLGQTYDLAGATIRAFTLSNILGLVAIRLKDDITDGDMPAADVAAGLELADGLERAALEIYQPYFSPGAPFWQHTAGLLKKWRAATDRVNRLQLADFRVMWDDASDAATCTAQLGAPLKISARAVWELTQGERAFEPLDQLLDSVSSAAVLHDHAVDWDADLRACRWNFFVAAISPLPQNRERENENRARVIRAWMEAGRAENRPHAAANIPLCYFDLIESHIARAEQCNATLGITGLETFLGEFHAIVCGTRDAMTRHFHEQLVQATARLFGKPLTPGRTRTVPQLERRA